MRTTGLYQILVDLGVEPDRARQAVDTLACEDQVATKADLMGMENRIIKWMVGVALVLLFGLSASHYSLLAVINNLK